MNRQQQLSQLTYRLLAADGEQDWPALAAVDREVAQALPRLAAGGAWNREEQAALNALRTVHRRALAHCESESVQLQQHLASMQANKEGWIAYALGGGWKGNAA